MVENLNVVTRSMNMDLEEILRQKEEEIRALKEELHRRDTDNDSNYNPSPHQQCPVPTPRHGRCFRNEPSDAQCTLSMHRLPDFSGIQHYITC